MNSLATHKTTDVRSRIEPHLKDHATEILAACGLNLSDAIRLFLKQVVLNRGLPFEVRIPNEITLRAMGEATGMNTMRFGTAKELFDVLEKTSPAKKSRRTARQ